MEAFITSETKPPNTWEEFPTDRYSNPPVYLHFDLFTLTIRRSGEERAKATVVKKHPIQLICTIILPNALAPAALKAEDVPSRAFEKEFPISVSVTLKKQGSKRGRVTRYISVQASSKNHIVESTYPLELLSLFELFHRRFLKGRGYKPIVFAHGGRFFEAKFSDTLQSPEIVPSYTIDFLRHPHFRHFGLKISCLNELIVASYLCNHCRDCLNANFTGRDTCFGCRRCVDKIFKYCRIDI